MPEPRRAVPGVLDQLAGWPVPSAAVAVVSPTGVLAASGPADRPYAWASVTKLLTTLTTLDAVARGLLDLDEPAGPPWPRCGTCSATPRGSASAATSS